MTGKIEKGRGIIERSIKNQKRRRERGESERKEDNRKRFQQEKERCNVRRKKGRCGNLGGRKRKEDSTKNGDDKKINKKGREVM